MSKSLFKLILIPKIIDDSFLYFAEEQTHIPFPIKRIYYITEPDKKLPRGYHAHPKAKQVLFCIQGSIHVTLDNGRAREEQVLDKPEMGVFIDSMVWVEMNGFKKKTILLVLASEKFDPEDYIRDYVKFKKLVNGK